MINHLRLHMRAAWENFLQPLLPTLATENGKSQENNLVRKGSLFYVTEKICFPNAHGRTEFIL